MKKNLLLLLLCFIFFGLTVYPDELTEDAVYCALLQYEIYHPEIVFAQAVLETGYFSSRIAVEYNNLFGLIDNKTGRYYKFNHWRESVEAYKRHIQRRYEPPDNYYQFLNNIGYAEDIDYIRKLKIIVNRHKNDNKRRSSPEGC